MSSQVGWTCTTKNLRYWRTFMSVAVSILVPEQSFRHRWVTGNQPWYRHSFVGKFDWTIVCRAGIESYLECFVNFVYFHFKEVSNSGSVLERGCWCISIRCCRGHSSSYVFQHPPSLQISTERLCQLGQLCHTCRMLCSLLLCNRSLFSTLFFRRSSFIDLYTFNNSLRYKCS
jgi:hypothetical protein